MGHFRIPLSNEQVGVDGGRRSLMIFPSPLPLSRKRKEDRPENDLSLLHDREVESVFFSLFPLPWERKGLVVASDFILARSWKIWEIGRELPFSGRRRRFPVSPLPRSHGWSKEVRNISNRDLGRRSEGRGGKRGRGTGVIVGAEDSSFWRQITDYTLVTRGGEDITTAGEEGRRAG